MRRLRHLVDTEWAARFGLSPYALHSGTVHLVVVDIGTNDAMSFLFDDTCVLVVHAEDLETARSTLAGLDPAAMFTADALLRVLGTDATVDGPSQHAYANQRTFRGLADSAVEPTYGADPSPLFVP